MELVGAVPLVLALSYLDAYLVGRAESSAGAIFVMSAVGDHDASQIPAGVQFRAVIVHHACNAIVVNAVRRVG